MESKFVFATCQYGMQSSCKKEILSGNPDLRLAFSRPGFLTFKISNPESETRFFQQSYTFVRASGYSLDKLEIDKDGNWTEKLSLFAQSNKCRHIHIYSRDLALPGSKFQNESGTKAEKEIYSPGFSIESESAIEIAKDSLNSFQINRTAKPTTRVLDCIFTDTSKASVGWHHCTSPVSRWVGGIPRIKIPEPMISRAYLKMKEAILWSRIPLKQNDKCVEIGCAPGGASQALLEHGVIVTGIDPAKVDESVANHENFTHLRGRSKEIKKKTYRDVRWLFVDINAAPNYTIDAIEDIVTRSDTNIRGMILTLKLVDLKLANDVESFINRVKSLGFGYVKTRQLAFNRKEFCLFALRRKALLRVS